VYITRSETRGSEAAVTLICMWLLDASFDVQFGELVKRSKAGGAMLW
jgi:hypothetical protein